MAEKGYVTEIKGNLAVIKGRKRAQNAGRA